MANLTVVRAHTRKKPAKALDPFNDQIEARKRILAARMKSREQWAASGWSIPRAFRALAGFIRSKIGEGR